MPEKTVLELDETSDKLMDVIAVLVRRAGGKLILDEVELLTEYDHLSLDWDKQRGTMVISLYEANTQN